MKFIFLLIFTLTFPLLIGATSETNGLFHDQTEKDFLQKIGVTYQQYGESLDILIDQEKAILAMQEVGMMDSDITQTDTNMTPVSITISVAMVATGFICPDSNLM